MGIYLVVVFGDSFQIASQLCQKSKPKYHASESLHLSIESLIQIFDNVNGYHVCRDLNCLADNLSKEFTFLSFGMPKLNADLPMHKYENLDLFVVLWSPHNLDLFHIMEFVGLIHQPFVP